MSACLAISAFMPSIASNSVFCTRRGNSGMEALVDNNPFVAAMNMDIAGAQVLKAGSGLSEITRGKKTSLATEIQSAEESIKALSKSNKVVNGIGKVLNYTAEHINPIICVTGAVKVATADDKKKAALDEACALGTMFAFEAIAKEAMAMSIVKKYNPENMKIEKDGIYKIVNGEKKLIAKDGKYKIINGKKLIISREGGYHKLPFLEKQVNALNDYCTTQKVLNKSIKWVPGTLQGLGFVCASIGGYKLGTYIAGKLTSNNAA